MRTSLTAVLAAGLLTLPVLDGAGIALAATKATPIKRVVTKKFVGTEAQADRWGTVTVTVTLRTTTTTTGRRRRPSSATPTSAATTPTTPTARSSSCRRRCRRFARSSCRRRAANVQMVSGATYTSEAFAQSLQSALLKAKAAKTT